MTNSDCSDRNEAANLVQEDKFKSLDHVLQKFIQAYSQGQTELKDLILREAQTTQSLIITEHKDTRAYAKTAQEDLELRRNLEKKREQLLNSLKDDSMNARKNQIERADGGTFSSVFDAETEIPWQNFTDWLRSDDQLYWISGKAGSGKSTLLNFLFEDQRTKEQLNKWRFGCAIYSHFIWSLGTPSQRSIRGLLRSLSYQILTENETIILDRLLQENARLLTFTTSDDWSRKDLEMVLVKSLSLHERGVCIFIDGLDEIDQKEGPFDLLELVKQISTSPSTKGVKLCVSSRPEPTFIQGLGRFPKLRLQDLTHQDMQAYISNFLQANPFDFEGIDEEEFVDRVTHKAEGVFLWVSLVLKSLQRGIANGDDPKELMQRLETLPSELGKLFEEMLKRICDDQPLYRKEAALYFNISEDLYDPTLNSRNLFIFAAAVDPSLRDKLLAQKLRPSLEFIKDNLLAVNRRLISRCAGLLETVTFSDEEEKDIEKILSRQTPRPWGGLYVALIHRSAEEFLLNHGGMNLDPDETTPSERKFRISKAIALEDLYPDAKHEEGYNDALIYASNESIDLSDEQRSEIFNLTKNIYQRNRWPSIYEGAASTAFDNSLEPLRKGNSQNQKALQNYLLLCVNPGLFDIQSRMTVNWTTRLMELRSDSRRVINLTTRLIEMGADLNAIFPIWIATEKDAPLIGLPTPKLKQYLESLGPTQDLNRWEVAEMEKSLGFYLCFTASSGVEYKFLDYEHITMRGVMGNRVFVPRRVHRRIPYPRNTVLVEASIVHSIQSLIEGRTNDPVERLAMMSRLGLDARKAHDRILLYWHGKTVYAVSDEQSQSLRNIGDSYSGVPASEALDQACGNLVQTMKGQEVGDVHQWLVARGYPVIEEKEVEGISKTASLDEMAEIYWRLNEKFGVKAQTKRV